MRLNKFISETGICSRREADRWIEQGLVTINGVRGELGTQVADGDDVRVRGRPLGARKKSTYIALNKPVGITCTTERHVQGNIIDFVNHPQRIFPIGRLDKDSEGLILLTNNGDIVNAILRAEHNHEKEYIVSVDKPMTTDFLSGMAAGVRILGTTTRPCKVSRIGKQTFRIILTQGLNRQIRRMCEVFGYAVTRLQRVRIMNVQLGRLKSGDWRNLTEVELRGLLPSLKPPARPQKEPARTRSAAPGGQRGARPIPQD
jgi:23S rRNA pseudouridine2604 synthase